MKIRIITHYEVHNHGAVLQLLALKNVLSRFDSSVCALEYSKNYDFMAAYSNVKYNISIRSIPFYIGFIKEIGLKRAIFNVKKRKLLNSFKFKKNLIGEYYSRATDIDAVFIGSDEVFSIESGLNPFFWGMGVPTKYVFAYAGCFGPTTIDFIKEKNAFEFVEAGLKRFDEISVRDRNSQEIIRQLSDKIVEQVCDPVILYGYGEEKKNFKRLIPEKYLFVYAYDNNMNDQFEYIHIKQYAREHGLKIITAGFYHAWCDKSINVDPIELLNWIAFADCVVTDTFHGTVMSLVMNVPFATKIRGNRNKLGFLLLEYGIEDREIKEFSDLSIVLERSIDYKRINKVIEARQKQGREYINKCISKI